MKLTLTAVLAAIPAEQEFITDRDLIRGVGKQIGTPISYKRLAKFLDHLYDVTPQKRHKDDPQKGELPFSFVFERAAIVKALASNPETPTVKAGRPHGISKTTLQLRVPNDVVLSLGLDAQKHGLDLNEHAVSILVGYAASLRSQSNRNDESPRQS